jgi:hypothetical protein
MDTLEKFVCEQNVVRFRERLEVETDAARRSMTIRLLIAEEDRLGFTLEQLANVDRHIVRCRELVDRQQERVSRMQGNGADNGQAVSLLETLRESLLAHEHYRRRICKNLDSTVL